MPQQSAQPKQQTKTLNTQPSQGLLQRLFGASPMTPEMEQGIAIARKENPNLAPVNTYGPLSRLMMGDANAYTSPGRQIYLNPGTMTGFNPEEVADTLTHEQTHVNQMADRGYGPTREFLNTILGFGGEESYGRRPDEVEAFQSEQQRQARMGRSPGVKPGFITGEMMVPRGDIHLPSPKGVRTGPSSAALNKLQRKK